MIPQICESFEGVIEKLETASVPSPNERQVQEAECFFTLIGLKLAEAYQKSKCLDFQKI